MDTRSLANPQDGELNGHQALVGRVVLADWVDSHRADGWHHGDVDASPLACRSAGLLVAASAEAVVVAGSWSREKEPQRCGAMTIPTKALIALRALE
ncbi:MULTISPECIES: hypothetical protein [Stenotrophomonas maltophilia group]|uniref:hypothetical protein n=1 Tax=Stenotrophomonas maltophilia group TaxID=995085 RepID=UPI00066D0506|nr:hypothetical protein [Stenotrophomonas maltophilia]ASE52237.1 hypothetical protein CEQ03_05400 [Stenotrophomonas maltophilia]KOO74819.1 hypothetical protein VK66_20415 [Stenotrophomonas maltophilia]MBH1421317.1 hypothetical protein [Stenotrophomonas maltophilia]MBH1782436.1 hypothetical protein [Stenotrophomonas maltophilia]MBN5053524.1 hypothetical protein [Stenotrophomonas maltophilia]